MKYRIFTIVGLCFVLGILATGARAQVVGRAQIPFDFSVRNKTVSAGKYLVSRNDQQTIWLIQGVGSRDSAALLAHPMQKAEQAGKNKLTFRRYGSKYFLAGIETSDYRVELAPSRDERNLIKEINYKRAASAPDAASSAPEILTINFVSE